MCGIPFPDYNHDPLAHLREINGLLLDAGIRLRLAESGRNRNVSYRIQDVGDPRVDDFVDMSGCWRVHSIGVKQHDAGDLLDTFRDLISNTGERREGILYTDRFVVAIKENRHARSVLFVISIQEGITFENVEWLATLEKHTGVIGR